MTSPTTASWVCRIGFTPVTSTSREPPSSSWMSTRAILAGLERDRVGLVDLEARDFRPDHVAADRQPRDRVDAGVVAARRVLDLGRDVHGRDLDVRAPGSPVLSVTVPVKLAATFWPMASERERQQIASATRPGHLRVICILILLLPSSNPPLEAPVVHSTASVPSWTSGARRTLPRSRSPAFTNQEPLEPAPAGGPRSTSGSARPR